MTDSASDAQIEAATAYEAFFVPALFQQWAPRVVAAAQLQPGQRVLDVACGTGVLAREAAARVGAAPRAAAALRAPFGLGDQQKLATLCASAGVAAVAITTVHGTAKFPSLRAMVEADLRGWLPVMGVVLSEQQITRILEEAEQALSAYVTVERRVEFDSPAHIVTGTRSG